MNASALKGQIDTFQPGDLKNALLREKLLSQVRHAVKTDDLQLKKTLAKNHALPKEGFYLLCVYPDTQALNRADASLLRIIGENPFSPTELKLLIIDSHKSYYRSRLGMARNLLGPDAVFESLAKDGFWQVREEVAFNPHCPPHIKELLAHDSDKRILLKLIEAKDATPKTYQIIANSNENDVLFKLIEKSSWSYRENNFSKVAAALSIRLGNGLPVEAAEELLLKTHSLSPYQKVLARDDLYQNKTLQSALYQDGAPYAEPNDILDNLSYTRTRHEKLAAEVMAKGLDSYSLKELRSMFFESPYALCRLHYLQNPERYIMESEKTEGKTDEEITDLIVEYFLDHDGIAIIEDLIECPFNENLIVALFKTDFSFDSFDVTLHQKLKTSFDPNIRAEYIRYPHKSFAETAWFLENDRCLPIMKALIDRDNLPKELILDILLKPMSSIIPSMEEAEIQNLGEDFLQIYFLENFPSRAEETERFVLDQNLSIPSLLKIVERRWINEDALVTLMKHRNVVGKAALAKLTELNPDHPELVRIESLRKRKISK